ncbi:hypothetical protein CLOM_g11632 [Closterium sp. NIES-68]|nr:hypothetical protein CLOM_g11632 [Closterium sp. NIES-68]GJP78229.1 hypothetical protein CLOP_g8559 [Closterium sp. NIES-67]
MSLEEPPLFSSKFLHKAKKPKKPKNSLDGAAPDVARPANVTAKRGAKEETVTGTKLPGKRTLAAADPGIVGKGGWGHGDNTRKAMGGKDTEKGEDCRPDVISLSAPRKAPRQAKPAKSRVQGAGFLREGAGEEARRRKSLGDAEVNEISRTRVGIRSSEEGVGVSRDGMHAKGALVEGGRRKRRKGMVCGERGEAVDDGESDGEREEGEEAGAERGKESGEDHPEDGEEGEEEGEEDGWMEEEEELVDSEGEEEEREDTAEDGRTEEDDDATAAALLAKADVSLSATATCDSFADLGLAPWLVATCHEMGLRHPTPVQCACIPPVVAGSNVIGVAQTGSGKTAAFALPILQKLAEDPYGVFALVLTPTRELALQIADQFKALGSSLSLRCAVAIGGGDMVEQAMQLASRPHVVVATPGRLREMLEQEETMGQVFSNLQFLVLDEADRLLDRGFEEEIGAILGRMPKERQTLLFSATFTANLHALKAMSKTKKLFHFEAYEGFKTVEALDQTYLFLPANVRDVYLCRLLSRLLPSLPTILPPAPPLPASAAARPTVRSVIVFTSSCHSCQAVSALLDEVGLSNAPLHALLPQRKRSAALHRFKASQVPILVATDVASRGLDIPTVDLVINYDIPRFTRDYVHRVGRTARAGRGGRAISLVTQYDVHLVHSIEKLIGRQLAECTDVTEGDVLKCISKVFKARRAALLKVSESGFEERAKQRSEQKRKIREERRAREGREMNT